MSSLKQRVLTSNRKKVMVTMMRVLLLSIFISFPFLANAQLLDTPKIDQSLLEYNYIDFKNDQMAIQLTSLFSSINGSLVLKDSSYYESDCFQPINNANLQNPKYTIALIPGHYSNALYNPASAGNGKEALIGGAINYLLQLGN